MLAAGAGSAVDFMQCRHFPTHRFVELLRSCWNDSAAVASSLLMIGAHIVTVHLRERRGNPLHVLPIAPFVQEVLLGMVYPPSRRSCACVPPLSNYSTAPHRFRS